LQRLLRRTLALPVQVDDATLSAALIDLVGGSAPDLLPWLPLIGIVAGVDIPATPEVDRLDPGVRRAKAESATSELLGKLLSSPTVLVLNDVHFMDEATLGLVRRLATDAKDRPWLIITTRRPTVDSPADPAPHVQTLELSPLEPASAEHLLAAATQEAPLPAHQLRRLTERAGGNPLFLTRLVRAALSGADLDALPDSLEGMIAAQIDRLPSPRRRWLRAASVLGMVVDPTWLEAMLAGSDLADQTWSGLEDFISMHLDSRLRFTHHLIRLTAYEGLPYRRRTELHARAADILEAALGRRTGQYATLLSLHCLHGGRYAAAWRYSRTAGDQARAQYAPSEAAECYRRALTAAKSVPDLDPMQVADVYAALAEVSMDLGEMPQAENALRQARRFARTDATRLARLQLTTARHRQHVGKHRDALRWVARGRATLARSEDPVAQRVRVELAERGALIRYDQGAYRAAMTWAARAVDEARSVGDEDLEARALGVLVGQAALAGMPVDESKAQESLDRYERAGDLRGKARTSNALGVWAYFAGRWDEAVGYYAEAERASAQIGREFDAAAAAANRAEVLIQQGRTEEAGAVLEPAVRTLLAANATSFLAFTVGLSGRVALARGDYAAAMDKLAEARAMCLEMGETGEAIALEAHCAQVYLRAGEIDQALRQVEETAERASGAGQGAVAAAHLHRVRGEALLARGQRDQGAQELRAALEVAREHDTSYEVEASLRALLECQVAASPAEAGAWRAEREALAVRLGIIG
jgi:tetratricopeptide (TPR) repeat protein